MVTNACAVVMLTQKPTNVHTKMPFQYLICPDLTSQCSCRSYFHKYFFFLIVVVEVFYMNTTVVHGHAAILPDKQNTNSMFSCGYSSISVYSHNLQLKKPFTNDWPILRYCILFFAPLLFGVSTWLSR